MNLKGILVGNAATDWTVDTDNTMMEFSYMHDLIDQKTYFKWRDQKCVHYYEEVLPSSTDPVCVELWSILQIRLADYDPYDIY